MPWIGAPGKLQKIDCSSKEKTFLSRETSYDTTIGGRTFAQVGRASKRAWELSVNVTRNPATASTLDAFVAGEYGLGPWAFIPDWAVNTNLLSANASTLSLTGTPQNGTGYTGGEMTLPDGGVAGKSMLIDPTVTVFIPQINGELGYVPIIPGLPITASIYVEGYSRLILRMYTSDKAITRSLYSVGRGQNGTVSRLTVSATVAANEAYALLIVDSSNQQNIVRVSRPAITHTSEVLPWAIGAGVPACHISQNETDVILATRQQQYSSAAYTVTEVG